jgi:hypothetical protein
MNEDNSLYDEEETSLHVLYYGFSLAGKTSWYVELEYKIFDSLSSLSMLYLVQSLA